MLCWFFVCVYVCMYVHVHNFFEGATHHLGEGDEGVGADGRLAGRHHLGAVLLRQELVLLVGWCVYGWDGWMD